MADDSTSRAGAAAGGVWTAIAVLAVAAVLAGLFWSGNADADVPPGAPVKLHLPGQKHATQVVPIRMEGNVLDPPRNYTEVGWWQGSAKPGRRAGQTVITGHTVHTGGGSFNRLPHLHEGQQIGLVTTKARIGYQIDSVETLSKAELAKDARDIFGQDHGDGRLVLVTCTDWNGTDYESNIVVDASRVSAHKLTPTKHAHK